MRTSPLPVAVAGFSDLSFDRWLAVEGTATARHELVGGRRFIMAALHRGVS